MKRPYKNWWEEDGGPGLFARKSAGAKALGRLLTAMGINLLVGQLHYTREDGREDLLSTASRKEPAGICGATAGLGCRLIAKKIALSQYKKTTTLDALSLIGSHA